MTVLKVPDHMRDVLGNFSHGGVEYKVEEDGYLRVHDHAVGAALDHGYESIPDDGVPEHLVRSEPGRPSVFDPVMKAPEDLTPNDIMNMSRKQLLAWFSKHFPDEAAPESVGGLRQRIMAMADGEEDELTPAEPKKPSRSRPKVE